MTNFEKLRMEFPALHQTVNGKPLVYLDSAASAQKPFCVLDAMRDFYVKDYANIHRGAHELSRRATDHFEAARETVRGFINAESAAEIVFTRGATESINLVAQSWGRANLAEGDEVLITGLEHHANIVPWQILRSEKKIKLVVAPITPEGDVTLESIKAALSPRTKLVAVSQVSNALGTVLPVKEITALAHARSIPVLVDGCQAVTHLPVDVRDLGADFYAFSGHKLYGPTGIGVLYGKQALLEKMPPWQGGGDMIYSVTFEETLFADPPQRFEAGTAPIAQAVGLAAAIRYVQEIGMEAIGAHEEDLRLAAEAELREIKGLRIIGTASRKAGLVSFVMDGVHPHDIGTILDSCGVAVRTGHHCAQPVMDALGIPATARASFALYNDKSDVAALVRGIRKVKEIFR
jgi:cysteine desulfurase/selenocysteine lyase